MSAIRHPVSITADENARLMRVSEGRTLHIRFGRDAVTLHPECAWPLPLLAEWRGVMEPLPPLTKGLGRAFRKCSCGRLGWYDYVPFSLSVPILAFPCGHNASEAAVIDEQAFYEAALLDAVAA
jgi:hypothetical protein